MIKIEREVYYNKIWLLVTYFCGWLRNVEDENMILKKKLPRWISYTLMNRSLSFECKNLTRFTWFFAITVVSRNNDIGKSNSLKY